MLRRHFQSPFLCFSHLWGETRHFLRALALIGLFLSGSFSAFSLMSEAAFAQSAPNSRASDDTLYEQLDLLMRVLERVRSDYVDDVNDREVIEGAIQGMLRSLDPHSTYLNPEVFEQVRVQTEGEYGGLGLEVQLENGVVKVVSPIDDTPAYKAGVKGGDYITHIDGVAVLGKSLNEAVKSMRGAVGEPITITIVREGLDDSFDLKIIRDRIIVQSVRSRVEADSIGYLRITTFNQQTGEGLENAIASLKKQLGGKLDGLILDLRNNPGGLLNEAIRVSDAFLDRGEIVSTRGRRRSNNSRWYASDGDLTDGLPLVVLINAYSASASEIVAGALKDHRRAVLIGDQSFGKGTVQSEIRLGRGDQAIRLTTARYYTPSGASIQGRGIEPDIEVLFPEDLARRARREADLNGAIENEQSAKDRPGEAEAHPDALKAAPSDKAPDSPAETAASATAEDKPENPKDIQLDYAIALLKNMANAASKTLADARP